jgi:predicted membrane-bound dolichyl-phosphate-mannose-protein mannosyltransferase
MLALCFALSGLALATGGRTRLAALPLALAVLTKQSYVAAPLCVLLTLWPQRRAIVTAGALFVGCLLLAVSVGTWLTGNELLWHTVVDNANPLDFDYFAAMLSAFAQFNALRSWLAQRC